MLKRDVLFSKIETTEFYEAMENILYFNLNYKEKATLTKFLDNLYDDKFDIESLKEINRIINRDSQNLVHFNMFVLRYLNEIKQMEFNIKNKVGYNLFLIGFEDILQLHVREIEEAFHILYYNKIDFELFNKYFFKFLNFIEQYYDFEEEVF